MMKKIMLMLICSLVFFSCEQEEILPDNHVESENKAGLSIRSASDVADPISQLDGVPVYIKSVSNRKYLSAEARGRSIYLAPNDDGSLRQRWNIRLGNWDIFRYYVNLVGGNSSYSNGQLYVFNKSELGLEKPGPTNINVLSSGDGITYNITTSGETVTTPFPILIPYYVQPKDVNSASVIAARGENKGDLIKWDVIPVDEFRVDDISYDLTTDDKLNVAPTQIATKTLVNDTDLPATRTISFQESITNESSFSSVEGLKVNISTSASAKVGIGSFVEGSFNMGVSTEKTWTYTVGGKETKTYTISESITQEIPPRTTIKAQLVATKYDATLTYIAKLYGINTGKTIYLKGKWNGAVVQESKIILTQQNLVLKMIKVTPKLLDKN